MRKNILAYINDTDECLSNFSRRLKRLTTAELISAAHVHQAVDLISLRHIINVRSNYGSMAGFAGGGIQTQLSATFDDQEVLEHWRAGRLVIANTNLSAYAERLLLLQADIRNLGTELVSKLSTQSDVKPLRERLEDCQTQRWTQLNAFSRQISDMVSCQSIGHGVSQISGIPIILYGFYANEQLRETFAAWREKLSENKMSKLRKSISKKPLPFIGRRSFNQIKLMFLDEDFIPVFRIKTRGKDDIEGYIPYYAISRLYLQLYDSCERTHSKYESRLFSDKIHHTLSKKKLNVPPTFFTPRKMLHELVATLMETQS